MKNIGVVFRPFISYPRGRERVSCAAAMGGEICAEPAGVAWDYASKAGNGEGISAAPRVSLNIKPVVRRGGVSLTFASSIHWRTNSEDLQQMPRGFCIPLPWDGSENHPNAFLMPQVCRVRVLLSGVIGHAFCQGWLHTVIVGIEKTEK
jgi:hypothetical protein